MRTTTTIITSPEEVNKCAYMWFSRAFSDLDNISWNKNRTGYIAKRLRDLLTESTGWIDKLNDISLYFSKSENDSKTKRKEFCEALGFFSTHGKQCDSMVVYMINILFVHLSEEGHIALRYGHQLRYPKDANSMRTYYECGLVSDLVIKIYAMSSNTRFKLFGFLLKKKIRTEMESLGTGKASTRQRSFMNILEVVAYFGITRFEDITVKRLIEYHIVNYKLTGSTLAFAFYLKIMDSINSTTYFNEFNDEIKNNIPKLRQETAKTNKTKIIDAPGLIKKFTCESIDVRTVELQHTRPASKIIKFGNFEFSVKSNLSLYHPENLDVENYWKKTQIDFVNQIRESGTKKTTRLRLSYLNSYLFDYLPSFFATNPEIPYSMPWNPSDFIPYIFVKHSITLVEHNFGRGNDIPLPISLLDYIYTITEEKAYEQGYNKTNSGRDAISLIQRYFNFIIDKFSSLEECKLNSNPISDWDKNARAGYSLAGSNKKLLELDYWILLKEFLKVLAYALVKNAEDVIFKGKPNQETIIINKKICWLEYEVFIGKIDLSCLGLFSFEDDKNPRKTTAYQAVINLYLIAWTALRDSNARWLDVNNFNVYCGESEVVEDSAELFVNTDKVRTKPFPITIPSHVLNLLNRVAKLRRSINRNGFNAPIYYNGEKSSKWGKISPLLQSTQKNSSVYAATDSFLLKFCKLFESKIEHHNKNCDSNKIIKYKSSIYTLPLEANTRTFQNTSVFLHADMDYSWVIRYPDYECRYTPLKQSVAWTPHSLRTTFDSVLTVLVDPETVGKIATGQGAATVGYYSQLPPHEVERVKLLAMNLQLSKQFSVPIPVEYEINNIVPAKDTVIDKDLLLESHAMGKAIETFNFFSLSHINTNNLTSPLDAFRQANRDQIAINRTHICPYNNNCPKDVIILLQGKKNCSICPYAILCHANKVGISAELKRLGDHSVEITKELSSENLLEIERENLRILKDEVINQIGGWLVRHNFLSKNKDNGSFYIGGSSEKHLNHIKNLSSSNNLMGRLIESQGVSTLQSETLKRQARQLTRRIKSILNKHPNMFVSDTSEGDDVTVALHMIKTICDVHDIEESTLVESLTSPNPIEVEWIKLINE
ncbi:hypothetical protein FJ444_01770 [Aestuariibacter sp. GS-14]|uniref:hypothetical protein n=1 Tax=Aestuariibacter sp. GS-14 TaxID=2590670 RepID=UPI001126A0D1|nr:hypothetical protein [Aestuariibacter sp. GS-14]TPV62019.1 hypothetical protein FJ444_01770 [Aestuariibacter sp. GS-14]